MKIPKLTEEQLTGLRDLAQSALSGNCDCVVVHAADLQKLLDEHEDLEFRFDDLTDGMCNCGRPAEYCYSCVGEE